MLRILSLTILIAALFAPATAMAGDAAAGKALYGICTQCHGESGKGDGPTGLALKAAKQPAPRDFTVGDFKFDTDGDGKAGTDTDLKTVIKEGAQKYGGNVLMAPNPNFSDADLDNLVAYIRSLKQ